MAGDVLNTLEIAELLRVTQSAVTQWCRTGKLPAHRAGGRWRVLKTDLDKFIRQGVPFVSEGKRTAA